MIFNWIKECSRFAYWLIQALKGKFFFTTLCVYSFILKCATHSQCFETAKKIP